MYPHRALCFICLFTLISSSKIFSQRINIKDSLRFADWYAKAFEADSYSPERQLYLDSILSFQPWNSYAWQQKAMPLFKQKKYELGLPYLDSAVKYDRGVKWLEYRAFMKCIFQKSYKAALTDFGQAERKNPGGIVMDHSYDFYAGLCMLQLNRFDSASVLISRSVDASIRRAGEGHYLEYMYLGICRMEQGKTSEAVTTLDKALKYFPRFSDARYYRGRCLLRLGKKQEAARELRQALADLRAGYSINEDNELYERYPYQAEEYMIKASLEKAK